MLVAMVHLFVTSTVITATINITMNPFSTLAIGSAIIGIVIIIIRRFL